MPSLDKIIAFAEAISCPISFNENCIGIEFMQHIGELWYYTLSGGTPDFLHATLLHTFDGFLLSPTAEDIDDSALFDDEALVRCTQNLRRSRHDLYKRYLATDPEQADADGYQRIHTVQPQDCYWIDDKFSERAGWIPKLAHVPKEKRGKHHIIRALSTKSAILNASRNPDDESILLPGLTGEAMSADCFELLAHVLESRIKDLTDKEPGDRPDAFLNAWQSLFLNQAFRISAAFPSTVGASKGFESQILIFDINPQRHEFHCYPSCDALSEHFGLGTSSRISGQSREITSAGTWREA